MAVRKLGLLFIFHRHFQVMVPGLNSSRLARVLFLTVLAVIL